MRMESVDLEVADGIATLTLDEPDKLNSLTAGIRKGLAEALAAVDANDAVRVAVITGRGDKAFCCGADISAMSFEPEPVHEFLNSVIPLLHMPESCSKPVIAAVNGLAYGGGFELAIACDFAIASERARFALPEIRLGLLPAFMIIRLQHMVGRSKAKELSMLGEPIDAAEAARLGLVMKVVPHAALMDEAMALARRLAAQPRLAIALAKSAYNRGLGGGDVRYSADAMPFLFMTEDAREGIRAFRDKRAPKFDR